MVKYRVNQALEDFTVNPARIIPASEKPTIPSTSVTATLGSPTLGASHPPSTLHGLVISSFPPRRTTPVRTQASILDPIACEALKQRVFGLMDGFDEGQPPFTIQRVCQLALRPREHYRTNGKYLRALERVLLVTSTHDAYPSLPAGGPDAEAGSDAASLKLAMTPMFSPIPFLHEDARSPRSRSQSRSPPLSPLLLPPSSASDSAGPAMLEGHALGMVDELDDPGPGHMADHPTALTEVTTVSGNVVPLPLSERFVKASTSTLEARPAGVIPGGAAEDERRDREDDDEVEDMVLDEKENEIEDVIKS
ncbi:PPP4R2-domain-containing protein [Auriculariales sp. MPI-PUGE-AT-0066]|nr:PPP4R2-domain-containing protein [Auriculariales sp. MPI-PUGE-AT-0066]